MKTILFSLLIATGFFAGAQTDGGIDYVLLPENLGYFTALRTGKSVSLEWQTVNEQNSKGFTVQRKTSGDWETLGFAPTRSLNGNSSVKVSYTYSDANAFKGITQYRVTEVTADGKQRRSEIRAVKGESQTGKALLYPNPGTGGRISLVFDDAAAKDILVVDATGRVAKQLDDVTNTTVAIENLVPGFYTIHTVDRATNEVLCIKALVTK